MQILRSDLARKLGRKLWYGTVAGIGLIAVVSSWVTSLPIRAHPSANETPTPVATRVVGWRNMASARVPRALQRTLRGGAWGGGADSPCSELFVPQGTAVWFVPPSLTLGHTYDSSENSVETYFLDLVRCGTDIDSMPLIFLKSPGGTRTNLSGYYDAAHSESGELGRLSYRFPPGSAPGNYLLELYDQGQVFTHSYVVRALSIKRSGPRIEIRDELSERELSQIQAGQGIFIDYLDFPPRSTLEVGLYLLAADLFDARLIDLWQITTDQDGNLRERVGIPPIGVSGDYALAACALECVPSIPAFEGQMGGNYAHSYIKLFYVRSDNVQNSLLSEITSRPTDHFDGFTNNDGSWQLYTREDAVVTMADGKLSIKVLQSPLMTWSISPQRGFRNFLAVIDTVHATGSTATIYGLVFRYVDTRNFYFYGISATGSYYLLKMVDNEWFVLIDEVESEWLNVGHGAYNQLGLLADGQAIVLFANGKELTWWTDASFANGSLGMAVVTTRDGSGEVHFDNLAVWIDPSVPGVGILPSDTNAETLVRNQTGSE